MVDTIGCVMYEPQLDKAISILERDGYNIEDPWDIVDAFEDKVAGYAGSKYAVAVDSCTNAMFLSIKYLQTKGLSYSHVEIPCRTYLSVPGLVIHAGCKPLFVDYEWSGVYELHPYPVIDGATRFTKDMYVNGKLHCLSFHIRKILPITKGGMILTDDKVAVDWLKLARYEGRNNRIPHDSIDDISLIGWNMYMPPEQAARGVVLFDEIADTNEDCGGSFKYRDLSEFSAWRNS